MEAEVLASRAVGYLVAAASRIQAAYAVAAAVEQVKVHSLAASVHMPQAERR